MIRWKQPEDPERGVSGNARQRRAVVRKWKAKGLRVRHFGGAGQFLVDVPEAPSRRADVRRAWEQPPCQQCGAMTDEEAATKCLGAAAGDDCHGNHLWPT